MICRIAGLGRPAWVARRGAGVGPVGPPKNGKRSRVAGQGEKPGKGFQFLQVDKYLCCKVLPNSINLPDSGSGKSPVGRQERVWGWATQRPKNGQW